MRVYPNNPEYISRRLLKTGVDATRRDLQQRPISPTISNHRRGFSITGVDDLSLGNDGFSHPELGGVTPLEISINYCQPSADVLRPNHG